MNWSRTDIAKWVGLATGALVAMLAAGEPERVVAVRLWLVCLGSVGVWAALGMLRSDPTTLRRDPFELGTTDPQAPAPTERPSFVRAGRVLTHASGSSGDLHFRARPVLRDIARARLADHGIDLDDPEAAPEAARRCGSLLWEVVRPDRPIPEDRHLAGLPPTDLPDLIAHLEAL